MLVEPLLEEQTQDLVDNFVPRVLLAHRVVYLGLVVPIVLAAVEGIDDLFEPVLRKVLELVLCLFHL